MFDFFIFVITFMVIYAILGLSLNLVVGYTGLLSVAQAAFYGIGAYATAILMTFHGFNFFAAVILSILVTALIAFLIGLVLSKFDGDYYALVSVGFVSITFGVFLNFDSLTRGSNGIPGIPKPEIFSFIFKDGFSFLILSLVFLAITYAVCSYLVNSSFGRALKAIREDEKALQVFGYNTSQYKLVIFIISAALAAVAGSLYTTFINFIDPRNFTILESVFILAVVIMGGMASLRGSILGAVVWIALPEVLRFVGLPSEIAAQSRLVLLGLILILLMMYRPQGFLGEYKL